MQRHLRIRRNFTDPYDNLSYLFQDISYFSTGAEGGNVLLDELDGTGGSLSMPPGTPEYHKVRLEMEQIHVSRLLSCMLF